MLVWRFYMQGTQVYGRSGYAQCCQHEEQTTRRGRDGMTGTWRQRVAPCTVIIVSSLIIVSQRPCWSGVKRHGYRIRRANRRGMYIFCYFFRLTDSMRRTRWSKRQIIDCVGNDNDICFPRGSLSKVYFFATYIRQFLQQISDYSFVWSEGTINGRVWDHMLITQHAECYGFVSDAWPGVV